MPLVDETFATVCAGIGPVEPDMATGQRAAVELQFGFGAGPEQQLPDQPFVKRTRMAPSTAIALGEAMVEEGKRLAALPDLAFADDLAAVKAEADAQAALRADHHTV
jgi:hypothetical protein